MVAAVALAAPSVAAARSPYFITEAKMGAGFEEKGVSVGGVKRTVLDAACQGQGYSRGSFPYEKFHLFLCYLTTSRGTLQVHATVTQDATNWYWNYVRVP
jgi:hypothetical protein